MHMIPSYLMNSTLIPVRGAMDENIFYFFGKNAFSVWLEASRFLLAFDPRWYFAASVLCLQDRVPTHLPASVRSTQVQSVESCFNRGQRKHKHWLESASVPEYVKAFLWDLSSGDLFLFTFFFWVGARCFWLDPVIFSSFFCFSLLWLTMWHIHFSLWVSAS